MSSLIDHFYIFGDSLSDSGSLFEINGRTYPADPPYFRGRFSNGRVWVEYLAEQFGIAPEHITNYARGGATASRVSPLAPNLGVQLQSFLQSHAQINSSALYIFWIGANDYFQGETSPVLPVEALTRAIVEVARLGGRKILVANLPDLGQFPATRIRDNAEALSALSKAHNLNLRRALKRIQEELPAAQIMLLDACNLYQRVMTNPLPFGLTNTQHAYLGGQFNHQSPEHFLFWDGIHITTAAHKLIAEMVFNLLVHPEAEITQLNSIQLPIYPLATNP
jgi:thermolabile hemolysin